MEQYSTNNYSHDDGDFDIGSPAKVSLVRIYLYLGLGLLLTYAFSVLLPFLTRLLATAVPPQTAFNVYMVVLAIGGICFLVSLFMVCFPSWRKAPKFVLPGYIMYASSVGVLLSLLVYMIGGNGSYMLTISFLITALCFMVMGLFGILAKKNLNILWPLLSSLCVGVLVISLVNFFMGLAAIYWIIEFVMFGVILLVIAIDIQNVTKSVNAGMFDHDRIACIYCAYLLYGDFITLLVRVLLFVVSILGRRR